VLLIVGLNGTVGTGGNDAVSPLGPYFRLDVELAEGTELGGVDADAVYVEFNVELLLDLGTFLLLGLSISDAPFAADRYSGVFTGCFPRKLIDLRLKSLRNVGAIAAQRLDAFPRNYKGE
jgi:hypothetical protein